MSASLPRVLERADIERLDGQTVRVCGHYQAIPRPRPGGPAPDAQRDHAILVLRDGTHVYLETLFTEAAVRPPAERARLDGKPVCAEGTLHRIMPSKGQGLLAPSLSNLTHLDVADLDATHP